jgi:hypothetical protein
MPLAAGLDRDPSLAAMWKALHAADFAAQHLAVSDPSVVPALLNARYYQPAQGQFLTEDPIRLDGDGIVRIILFLFRSKHPISSIKRVRFDGETDSFGGPTTYVTIEFSNARPFLLFDFSKADLREIIERISATVPNVIDPDVRSHLNAKQAPKRWIDIFRPGDWFIFAGGAIFIIISIFWRAAPKII